MKPVDDFADLVGAGAGADPAPAADTKAEAAAAEPAALSDATPAEPKAAPPADPIPSIQPALDPADASVLAAHEARQQNWENEAKQIFFGPTEEEKRKQAILDELTQIDARNAEERNRLAREAEKREAGEKAAALREENVALKQKIKDNEAEAKRLDALAKA